MAIGAIGGCSDCATQELQRGTAFKAPGEPPLSAAAEASRLDDKKRDGDQGIIFDLRVNPPEDTARIAARRDYEGAAGAVGQSNGGTDGRVGATSITQLSNPNTQALGNPDTQALQRSVDQTYQAVEASDAKVAPRGGVFDLSI